MFRLLMRCWRWLYWRCYLRPEGFLEHATLTRIQESDVHVFRGASGQEYTILHGDPAHEIGDLGYMRKLPDHGIEFVLEDQDLDDLVTLKDL